MDKHRTVVGYDKDVDCSQQSAPSLVEVLASQVLNHRSHMTDDAQLNESAHVYLAEGKRGWLRTILKG